MRDSSTAYRTAYLTDYPPFATLGQLETGGRIPAKIMAEIPREDHEVVAEEAAADPSLSRAIIAISGKPGWVNVLTETIRKVILNEVNPLRFPDTRGKWLQLRKRVREMQRIAIQAIEKKLASMTPAQKIAEARRIAAGRRTGMSGLGELGQWAELFGAVATAAGSVYGAKVTADAQEELAKIQANAAKAQLNAQLAMANAQQAMATQQTQQASMSSPFSSITSSLTSGGMGSLILPMAAGLAIYLLFGQNKR